MEDIKMTLEDLAEQVLATVYEFSEDGDADCIILLEDAIDSGKDLEFAIDAAISYLHDCDCEDVDYYQNKLDQITEDSDEDV